MNRRAYLLVFTLVVGGMLSSACGVAGAGLLPVGDLNQSRSITRKYTWACANNGTAAAEPVNSRRGMA